MRSLKNYKQIFGFMFISICFCALLSPYTSVLNSYYGIDTAQYWVIGSGILQGKVPYVDLFDHKGPVIFLIWALGIFIGNGTKWGIFILQVLSLSICLFYINKILDFLGATFLKKSFVYVAFLFVFCGVLVEGGLTEEWSLPWTMYDIFVALEFIYKKTKHSPCFYAFLFGIQFAFLSLMRINNAAGLGAVLLFLIICLIKGKQYKEIVKCAVLFVCGGIIFSLPIFVWFWKNGALTDMMFGCFQFNYGYAVRGLGDKAASEWLRIIGYEGLTFLVLSLSFVRDMMSGKRLLAWEYFLSFMVVLFCGVSCMLGDTWPHYFMVFLPAMVLVMGLMTKRTSSRSLFFVLLIMILPYTWQTARNVGKNLLFMGFDYYGKQQDELMKISEIIPEEDRDSVWALEWRSSKWFAVNRLVPYYKVFDFPHVLNDKKLYQDTLEMLEERPPKWILQKADSEGYMEGYIDYLEKNYYIEDYVDYQPETATDAPDELVIGIWRRKE